MRRRNAIALMATIVGGAIAAGSGLTAWASWAVSATPVKGTVRAERMPPVEKFAVKATGGTLTFSWHAATFASGAPVGGYRVRKSSGDAVCQALAGELSCTFTPAAGTGGTFVVLALAGSGWVGPASAPVTYVPGKETGTGKLPAAAKPPVTGGGPGGSAPQATPGTTPTTPAATATGTAPGQDVEKAAEPTPDSPAATTATTDPAPAPTGAAGDPATPAG
ncbi:hypothetical protein [Actinoplanes sp. HUAS TT8]|uniref:hypothetical protein n=1 Tax=Actinoplanes sp. HUAS TT8 TaxID=3447453 RepID=UPI003F51BCB1